MNNRHSLGLNNVDPDDLSDVLIKIERSFGFRFKDNELEDLKTFGEFCDIVAAKTQGENSNDCTTQQLFYRLRIAIARIQLVDKDSILIDTQLQHLFPQGKRRQKIRELQKILGMSVDILTISSWLSWTILTGIICSIAFIIVKWQFGLIGIAGFTLIGWMSNKLFADQFELSTVGALAERLTRENYLEARRDGSTINRNEIERLLKEFFQEELYLEADQLTRESALV